LQYAISAEAVESKKKGEDETTFIVTTDERKYQFKADSAASAKEWVRSIQKVIFRTHNEGNSVKISLPIQNVIEIEESSILNFADTVKVRVVDNGETFAIDEVRVPLFRWWLSLIQAVFLLILQQRPGRAQRLAHHGQ
jgi:sterol 3beta-glucosyltransferase